MFTLNLCKHLDFFMKAFLTSVTKIKWIFILVFVFFARIMFSQNADLVVSAGYNFPNEASFSSDGRMLATVHATDVVKIWDVKTGREIRSLIYKLENVITKADSCWFTDNNTTVTARLSYTNDLLKFDLETRVMNYIKSDVPYDYTKMYYSRMYKSATNLTMEKKNIIELAPDGMHQVIFEPFVSRDKWKITMYRIKFKNTSTKKEILLNDSTTYGFSAISSDSKYIFIGSKTYDFETGKIVSEIQSANYTPFSLAFLPGTHIPVTCAAGGIRAWDFPKVRSIIKGYFGGFYTSKDFKRLAGDVYSANGTKRKMVTANLDSLKIIDSIDVSSSTRMVSGVSDNAEQFVTYEYKPDIKVSEKQQWGGVLYEVVVTDIIKKKTISSFISAEPYFMPGSEGLFLKDFSGMYDGDTTFKTYNLKNKTFGKIKLEGWKTGYMLGQSLDKKYIFNNEVDSLWAKQKLNIWDLSSGKKVNSIVFKGQLSSAHQVTADNKLIAFATNIGNDILVHTLADGKQLFNLKGHTAYVWNIVFSGDNKRLLSSSFDGTKKLWNLETGKEIVTMIDLGEDDYAIVTPDQYYYCTKGATKYIHFVKNLKIYPFEQFDLKYNRPDIIMQRIGVNNIELEKSYKYAHDKRLKKMGFTEEQLSGEMHLPELEIKNATQLPLLTENSQVKLKISAKDTKYKLDRMLIRVNGVPVNGIEGFSVKNQNISSLEKETDVLLSNGKNKIEVSVLNSAGVESIAESIEITYNGKNEKPSLYIVTVGVSKYKDKRFNLNYAAKDAENIFSLFKSDSIYKNMYSMILNNDSATIENEKRIKKFLEKTTVNDHVIFFVAGHGVLDANLNYYLATYDMDFEHPETKGLSYETLENMLDGIPARNKLLLMDACHSGEVDKDEMALAVNTTTQVEEGEIKFRNVTGTSVKQVGLSNSFEMMKELFTDIRKGNGTVVISSAGGAEYAMEGTQWNNGVFTYCLLSGIKGGKADSNHDGKIMISELQKYLQEEVTRLTNGKQKPTSRVENLSNDWRIW